MRKAVQASLGVGLVIAASTSGVVLRAQERPLERTFEDYERIRAALAQDTTKDIAAEARALASLALEIAGDTAGSAVASLAESR